jgi:hypothetical protein
VAIREEEDRLVRDVPSPVRAVAEPRVAVFLLQVTVSITPNPAEIALASLSDELMGILRHSRTVKILAIIDIVRGRLCS